MGNENINYINYDNSENPRINGSCYRVLSPKISRKFELVKSLEIEKSSNSKAEYDVPELAEEIRKRLDFNRLSVTGGLFN